MGKLEIYMHKSSLNFRQLLKLLLEILADIMCLVQNHVFWQDYVNLRKVMVTESVCPNCVNVLDLFMVIPYQVC